MMYLLTCSLFLFLSIPLYSQQDRRVKRPYEFSGKMNTWFNNKFPVPAYKNEDGTLNLKYREYKHVEGLIASGFNKSRRKELYVKILGDFLKEYKIKNKSPIIKDLIKIFNDGDEYSIGYITSYYVLFYHLLDPNFENIKGELLKQAEHYSIIIKSKKKIKFLKELKGVIKDDLIGWELVSSPIIRHTYQGKSIILAADTPVFNTRIVIVEEGVIEYVQEFKFLEITTETAISKKIISNYSSLESYMFDILIDTEWIQESQDGSNSDCLLGKYERRERCIQLLGEMAKSGAIEHADEIKGKMLSEVAIDSIKITDIKEGNNIVNFLINLNKRENSWLKKRAIIAIGAYHLSMIRDSRMARNINNIIDFRHFFSSLDKEGNLYPEFDKIPNSDKFFYIDPVSGKGSPWVTVSTNYKESPKILRNKIVKYAIYLAAPIPYNKSRLIIDFDGAATLIPEREFQKISKIIKH